MVEPERLVPEAIRSRYQVKFLATILAVTLVIGLVGTVSYVAIGETVRADANEQLASTAELQADGIGDWVDSMRVQTSTTSSVSTLENGDPPEVQGAIVEQHARLSPDVRAVHVVDAANGTVEASTRGVVRGESLGAIDEPWTDADFDAAFISDEGVWNTEAAYEDAVLRDEVMAFASPVTGTDDRVVVLIGTLEHRVEQLDRQGGIGTTTAILDADGDPVLRPAGAEDAAVGGAEDATVGDAEDVGAQADEDAVAAAVAGRARVVETGGAVRAYAPVGDTGWAAVASVPVDDAYGVADDVAVNVLAMLAVSLVALGVVGVVVSHQTVAPLDRLRDRAERMERGDLDVDLGTSRVDEIGRLYEGFDSMRTSLREQIRRAETAREEAEAARAESEAMAHHLERTAEEYREVMEACADGDLTRRLDPDGESEAMTAIAHAFNGMVADLEATTADLKAFAADVSAASEEVTASAEEVQSASGQVTRSVQQISDGTDRQEAHLREIENEMGDLSTTTEQIAASSNEVADVAHRTAETGRAGREAAQEAIEGMAEVEAETDRAVAAIEDLEAGMERVDELIEFISDVAKQTNMLALNANIEASRGSGDGDDGGFAVVAGEVKELAAETKRAASDVEEILAELDDRTGRAATEVQRTADRVATHADSVENAADALDEIAAYALRTNDGVQEISAATQSQAASTQEAVAMVSRVTTISEATSAEAERVAAAAEEQTSAMSEVSESASALAGRAARLHRSLERFETDVKASADAPAAPDRDAADPRPEVVAAVGDDRGDGRAGDVDEDWDPFAPEDPDGRGDDAGGVEDATDGDGSA